MINIAEALSTGLQLHRSGDIWQAETIYRQILEVDPSHADALHLLGMIAYQTGNHQSAVDLIERAVALMPESPVFHSNLGLAYQALGRLDRATASCREAVRLQPEFADAQNNLANVLAEQEQLNEAVECYQHAVALNPTQAVPYYNLASALAKQGKLDEAAAHYEQALSLKPDYMKAHLNLGILFLDQDKLQQALEQLQEAVRLDGRSVAAHNNLGNALKKLGKLDTAEASYRLALLQQPDCAEAHFNLGNLYAEQAKLDLAIDCFKEALRFKSKSADLSLNALISLANVFSDQGQPEQAIHTLEQANELQPSAWLQIAMATQLPVVYQSMSDLETWRERFTQKVRELREQEIVHELTDKPALIAFYLPYQGHNDRDLRHELAQLYRAPEDHLPIPTRRARSGKIRVGFLSAGLKKHSVGHWIRGLIANLSRDDFEVTSLSIGIYEDDVARFIKQHTDRYVEVPRNLSAARRLVAEQQLDVLVFPDVGIEATATSLAFSRLAPVQCTTLGHPVTTGIDTIDYFVSAENLETDEAQEHYTETLVKLKTPPIYFYRPQAPEPLQEREQYGLRKDDHVYVCLQSAFKLHPEFDEFLGGILRGDPRGVLVLSRWATPQWEELLRERFSTTLADVLDRIRFLPLLSYPDYLNILALADVQLDPIHFGGGSTSYEGLAMGTPIVTMPGQFLRGRFTYGLYKQMQMLDCVAQSPQEYVNIALRLGTDPDYRQTIRDKILGATDSILFENSQGIREFEEFLKRAVEEGK